MMMFTLIAFNKLSIMRWKINPIYNTLCINFNQFKDFSLHWHLSRHDNTSVRFAWPSTCGKFSQRDCLEKGNAANVARRMLHATSSETLWKAWKTTDDEEKGKRLKMVITIHATDFSTFSSWKNCLLLRLLLCLRLG